MLEPHRPGMVAPACNPSTQATEAGALVQVQGHPELYSKTLFQKRNGPKKNLLKKLKMSHIEGYGRILWEDKFCSGGNREVPQSG